ncbi:transposase [Pseudoclavibacter helvolus]
MGRPSKYPRELRERAVRMVVEVRADYPSEYQAMTAVAQMLGIGSPETIRTWIRREQVDAGDRPGVTTDAAVEIKRLKRENAELRRANEILKAASAFFAAELDRPHKRESPSSTNTRTAPRAGSDGVSSRSALCSPSTA